MSELDREFYVAFATAFPEVWPVHEIHRIFYVPQGSYLVSGWLFPGGSFFVSVESRSGEMVASYLSPEIPFRETDKKNFICEIFFKLESRSIAVFANGKELGINEPSHLIEATPVERLVPARLIDVDKGACKKARNDRQKKLQKLRNNGFRNKHRDRRIEDLKSTYRVLKTASYSLANGNHDYVSVTSIMLRKLILPGDANEILQDCASFGNRSLFVWTRKSPRDLAALNNMNDIIFLGDANISPYQTNLYKKVTDLDAWRNSVAIKYKGNEYSHYRVLKYFADKFGAHSDVFDKDLGYFLQELIIAERSMAAKYLGQISDVVITLIRKMVEHQAFRKDYRPKQHIEFF